MSLIPPQFQALAWVVGIASLFGAGAYGAFWVGPTVAYIQATRRSGHEYDQRHR